MFYFFKIPTIIQKIYPNYLWKMPGTPKAIYLTFDDGPTPEVTEWVLAVLEKYNAKATFFCEGKQVEKYPQILKKTFLAGHRIGNHSHLHRNGWKTKKTTYIADVERAKEIIEEVKVLDQKLKLLEKRLHKFNSKKYWIIDFCDFQYGILKEENNKNKPHQSYISLLKKISYG